MIERDGRDQPSHSAAGHDHLRAARSRLSPSIPSSGVRHPGTFSGWSRRLDYLPSWASRPSSCLPVDEFDENDCPFVNPLTGERLQELLGLQSDRLLRAQGGLCHQSRAVRTLGRVLRHGRRVPRAGDRGLSRRRLQPHGRRGRRRADLQLPRAGQFALLHARRAAAVI